MGKRDAEYTVLAEAVVEAVGGKENIISVTNCMTRLRFVLKDDTLPKAEKVKAIKGVAGVMNQGGQYQVIIGTHVSDVTPFVRQICGISTDDQESGEAENKKKDNLWNRFFKTISGCIIPMIGPMIAGGIIKGILTILVTVGLLTKTDGTYLMLYAASDAVLYFMPIIVGFSAGKVFNCNPYVTAVIGAAFLYPDLVNAVSAEGGITFLGIPVANASYASTLFPILMASFVASLLEKLGKKFIPRMLQLMLVPSFVLALTVPLAWLVIGPVMNTISGILSTGVNGIFGISPVVGGVLIGAFWQVIVLLGLHAAFIPILINNLVTTGSDPINAVMGLTVWALAGTALGYALRQKDIEKRTTGFGCMASALCGVTEPTIYSIALPNIKTFAAAWVGGGIAGGVLGALGGRLYGMAGDGLFRIPGMINPAGLDISFYGFIVCALAAMGASAVISFIFSGEKAVSAADGAETNEVNADGSVDIAAFVDGTLLPIEKVEDETFSQKLLGDGVAIEPVDGLVSAPAAGKIVTVMEDSKHALGIELANGTEILIHAGLDTVDMKGEGFEMLVSEGDSVKKGTPLLKFDLDKVAKAGHKKTVVLVVTDAKDRILKKFATGENVKAGESCILQI